MMTGEWWEHKFNPEWFLYEVNGVPVGGYKDNGVRVRPYLSIRVDMPDMDNPDDARRSVESLFEQLDAVIAGWRREIGGA